MPEHDDIFDAIAEFNRSYLTLALRLLQADREAAQQQLGMSDEAAALVVALTPAQIDVLAERRELFCEFRAESSPAAPDAVAVPSFHASRRARTQRDIRLPVRTGDRVRPRPAPLRPVVGCVG
ncbi:flagellar transcriptional regulator FlhD [Burkholderia cepacia]